MNDEQDLRVTLMEQTSQLGAARPQKGFALAIGDIDIDIYEYEAYIAGLVESSLSGTKIDPSRVDLGADLDRRLDRCLESLRELGAYHDRVRKVAQALVDYLSVE